jgi:hypothetical protein
MTGLPRQGCQDRTAWIEHPEQDIKKRIAKDSQNSTASMGQQKVDRQNRTSRGQAERDRQNRIGKTGKAERNKQNRTRTTVQASKDLQTSRTGQ